MRIRDVTSTQGTGPYHLDLALSGYDSVLEAVPDGSAVDYIATDGGGTNYEVGRGVISRFKRTITRTVRLSSNSNNAVNWGAGIKHIEAFVGAVCNTHPMGAMVKLTADEVYGAGTKASLPWDAEIFDYGGCWDSGSPTRLTVPSGWQWVQVSTNLRWDVHNGVQRSEIRKNDLTFWEGMPSHEFVGTTLDNSLKMYTPPLQVKAGDFFEVWTGDSLNGRTIHAVEETWFAMELLG